MSKLSEWISSDFIGLIDYLKTNEPDKIEIIYNWLIANYGNKPVSAMVVAFTAHSDAIADVINLKYENKWTELKFALSENVMPLTGKENIKTVTKHNKIYGYNSDSGTDDFEETTTTNETIGFDDVFKAIESNIDIRDKLSYYYTIVKDIAHELTNSIYESEDD